MADIKPADGEIRVKNATQRFSKVIPLLVERYDDGTWSYRLDTPRAEYAIGKIMFPICGQGNSDTEAFSAFLFKLIDITHEENRDNLNSAVEAIKRYPEAYGLKLADAV